MMQVAKDSIDIGIICGDIGVCVAMERKPGKCMLPFRRSRPMTRTSRDLSGLTPVPSDRG